uniref:LKAAEAR motif containing 1 n=1 Tax=Ovis aries TaxID=9940 RepID=A0AC11BB09_SHEEP
MGCGDGMQGQGGTPLPAAKDGTQRGQTGRMASPPQQASCPLDSEPPPHTSSRMQPEPGKETGRRGPRERANKGAQGAGAGVGRGQVERPKPGWALTLEGLAAMRPAQRHSHLLFGDLLEDVGAATCLFPCESAEVGYRMPDSRAWTLPLEPPAQRQDRLLGVLKAAEARGRVRALRLRYARMRAEEISLLIQRERSARAAIRLELFLPPQLKPTRIPDPLDRQERRRVETILEEKVHGSIFPR